MSDVLPWLEYRWNFDFPVGMYRALVERLRGTPDRLEAAVRGAGDERLTRHQEGTWSAQEHAGHFLSVERLWEKRLAEYLRGEARLTAADMENKATKGSGYNERPLDGILTAFRLARAATLATLDRLGLEDAARVAHHPRLDRPMRLVDLCFFAAEHDDHHLAAIRALLHGE